MSKRADQQHRAGRYITQADNLSRTAANGHRILEHLYEHPIISVKEAEDLIGTSYTAANDLITRLTELGILHEFTGQARNRRFNYADYIGLFNDGAAEVEV